MRIRRIFFVAAVVFCAFFAVSAYAADVAKIGVVNFQKIFEVSEAGKIAKEEINTHGQKLEADLKEKGAEIEALKEKYEREAYVMNKDMRDEKGREFRIKVNDFKSLQKKYETELQNIQKKLNRFQNLLCQSL